MSRTYGQYFDWDKNYWEYVRTHVPPSCHPGYDGHPITLQWYNFKFLIPRNLRHQCRGKNSKGRKKYHCQCNKQYEAQIKVVRRQEIKREIKTEIKDMTGL